MLYNSQREPADRPSCANARHSDHYHPGYHPVLLRGVGCNNGCTTGRPGKRDGHAVGFAHFDIGFVRHAGVEYVYPDGYTDTIPDSYSNRDTDHHLHPICSTDLDAVHHADCYLDKYSYLGPPNFDFHGD